MTSSIKSIMDYHQKAIEAVPQDHPDREEILKLLQDQVNDDLRTHANTRSSWWTN